MTKQRNKLTIKGLLFTLVMLMGTLGRFPLTANAAEDLDVQITKADGTPATVTLKANDEGYYEIGTADELYAFAAAVNGGNGAINGKLTKDIVINESVLKADGSLNGDGSSFRVWTPINTGVINFTGTFDGAGHIISGLYFNDSSTNYVGLFGAVDAGGTVQKVGLTDSYFNGWYYVGGIAGVNNGTITNCYTTGTVNGMQYVGGVVGYNSNTVASCYSAGTTNSLMDKYVGGIVGYNNYSASKVQNSFFNSTLYNGNAVGDVRSGETVVGTVDNVDGKDTKAFASGEVAYLLNGDQTELVFKQTLDTDAAPNFTGESVYQAYIGCAGGTVYSNDEALKDNEGPLDHLYNNGICAVTSCTDKYESATLNAAGYYEIDNAGKLFWFAAEVNRGTTGINGKLTENIEVNKSVLADGSLNGDGTNFLAWTPIGTSANSFTGIFDGAGHTISGLYFNNNATRYVGLFGVVGTGGTIEKVGVTDSYFYGEQYIGGIAGQNGGTIRNCYNGGAIQGKGSVLYYYIGGVAGKNTSTIENSYNVGIVKHTGGFSNYVGGLVGNNEGKVINSYSMEGDYDAIGKKSSGGSSSGTVENTGSKTAEQFASGEVAYLLGSEWGQNLGENGDAYPVLGGVKVYFGYLSCADNADRIYTNDSTASETKPEHDVNNYIVNKTDSTKHDGTCSICNAVVTEDHTSEKDENKATCKKQAVCDNCGVSYGELGGHTADPAYTLNAEDSTLHDVTYSCCDVEVTEAHTLDANGKCTAENCGYQYAAKVGDSFYETIHKALRAAEGINGCTLILLDNITLTSTSSTASYVNTGTFTLDLNGKTFASNKSTLNVLDSADLTVKDSIGSGKILSTGSNAIYQTGGKLTIESGTFEGSLDGVFLSGSSTLTVKGGTFTGSRAMITGFGSDCVIDLTNIDPAGFTLKNNGSGTFAPELPEGYGMVGIDGKLLASLSAEQSATVHKHEYKYTDLGNGNHQQACSCGLTTGEPVGHSTTAEGDRAANCGSKAYCSVCDSKYGEVDKNNHDETVEYKNGFCPHCDIWEPAELKDGYYQIKNAGNLYWYADYVNTKDRTASAVLVADIDLEGKSDGTGRKWTPIGSTGENSNNFRGVFDGQGYTITGLYVEGGRAGLGFFGEVRTGTVKNFTIYGDVVVNTEVDYVGGVIGSICGVNGETDLERNGAIIQNITSYVNLTAKAHGVGMIGGFVGYANHQSLIENCSWYGTFDAGIYRVDSGAGGFIGKIRENTSEVTIRNCAAYGTIKTNYAGDYNNTTTIYMGGFLSFSNTGAKTVLENCLFAGKFVKGENLTDEAQLAAFGTLSSIERIENCYYLADDGLAAVHTGSEANAGGIIAVTAEQLKSGEVAHLLQGEQTEQIWGQTIDTDSYPVLGGDAVYQVLNCKEEEVYSNTNENLDHQWDNDTCTVCGETNDFVIEGASEGWNVTDDVLTFTQGGAYTVSLADGKTETSQVIVVDAEGVTLTLNQITINAPNGIDGNMDDGIDGTEGTCALTLNYDAALVLVGENTLIGGKGGKYSSLNDYYGYDGGAGISALDKNYNKNMVTVSGEGSLTARGGDGEDSYGYSGGNGGAGIDGSVTLYSGTVTVIGGTAGVNTYKDSGNGETGAGLTGTITAAGDKMLKIKAGDSKASAEEKTVYSGEQYAEFAVCVAAMEGKSLSINGDIGVNFYLKLDSSITENATVKFILPNGEEEELKISEAGNKYDSGRDAYKLSTAVAAAEMAETITVQVFTGDSNEAAEEFTYSVVEYAKTIFGDQEKYGNTVPLMQTMLNYGAMAQTYFDRNTGNPANAILDEYDLSTDLSDISSDALKEFEAIIPETGLPEGMAYAGTSLLLEAEVTLRHYFTLEEGTATPTVNNGWSWVARNGKYYAEKTGIVAAELDTMQSLTIDTWTMEYSPLSYVKKVLEAEETRTGAHDLMKALYYYNQAANTYFAN